MPDRHTVFDWLSKHPDFNATYARAREDYAAVIAEELMEIVDNETEDLIEVTTEKGTFTQGNHVKVQRDKLRADTRKWLLSKLAPNKYGERLVPATPANEVQSTAQSIQKALREIEDSVPPAKSE